MRKKKGYIISIIATAVFILAGIGVFIMNSIAPKNVFGEMYLSVSNPSLTKSRFRSMNGVDKFSKELDDSDAYYGVYTSDLTDNENITIGVSLAAKTVQFAVFSESSTFNFELLYIYIYHYESNQLEIYPVSISYENSDPNSIVPTEINSPKEVAKYLDEHNITREEIEEYRDYYLNKIMADWVEGNGDKSKFSVGNYGEFTIVDRTFEGMGDGWE